MNRKSIFFLCAALLCGVVPSWAEEPVVADFFRFADGQLRLALTEIRQVQRADSAAVAAGRELAEEPSGSGSDRIRRLRFAPRSLRPDGSLQLTSSRAWTSGFFPGELWYLYEYTHDPFWLGQARSYTELVEPEKSNARTHDMGFKIYCSFGNGYRLTHDAAYRDVLLEAAATLATRFSERTGTIRSWDHIDKWRYPVIIDNMMNLELLFWAARESGDSTYRRIAVSHADRTLENHFRPDFSVYHVVDYDPETGRVLDRDTHQGYARESVWARGEAWALYGFTMCYRETHDERYLDRAREVARCIRSHPRLPADLVPYWDYDAPGIPDEPRDVSAAAVAASALYELSLYDAAEGAQHRMRADRLVAALASKYRTRAGGDRGFLLRSSTGSKPHDSEVDVPIVYADYYFLEALLRKRALDAASAPDVPAAAERAAAD